MRLFYIYYICIFIFFCGFCGIIVAQENAKTNSLKKVLLSSKPDSLKANALNELFIIYRAKGELDSANYFVRKALQISKKSNYKYGEANALYYIGIVSYIKGDYINAIDTLTRASEMYKAAGNEKDYSTILTVIGGVKTAMGDLPGALECQLQSMRIKESIGDSSNLASVYINIGNVYSSTEELEKALLYFQRALKLNIRFKNFDRLSDNYFNIANIYSTLKYDSLALVNINISIHISDSLGRIESLSYSYGLVASIKLDKNDYIGAVEYYKKSIAISEKLDDKRMIAAHCQRLGVVYQKMGDEKKAESYILRALQIAEEINYLENIIDCHRTLSNLYEENGDYKKALFHFKEYKDAKDTLINEEKGKEMTRKEMNYEFEKKLALDKLEQDKKDIIATEKAKKQKIVIYSVSTCLFLVLFLTIFIFRSYRQKQRANIMLQQQKEEISTQRDEIKSQRDLVTDQKIHIEEIHKDLTDSINYAERIQRSFLATKEHLDENLSEYFVLFLPKDVVSGDFYWAGKLSNGNFALATADSTGHGVPGAIMSILNITSLEKAVEQGVSEPSEILNLTRKTIIERLKKDGSLEGGKDGMDASLICFDFVNNKFTYSAANNQIWVIRENQLIELNPDKMPVGKHDKDQISFTQHEFKLQKNDVIYTFTDGFPDQFGGPQGRKFMYKQFKELLLTNCQRTMKDQKDIIEKTLKDWIGNYEQVDDITILGLKL